MEMWIQAVEVIRESIFAYAQVSNGNLAYGIMAVTFLARLALFPLTLRLARAAAAQQETMRRVAPELDAARTRFKDDPVRLAEETRRIFAREGVSMIPAAGCVGALLQMPVLLALFDAVRQSAAIGGRFLWIRDISKPDVALAMLVAAVTAASMAAGPHSNDNSCWSCPRCSRCWHCGRWLRVSGCIGAFRALSAWRKVSSCVVPSLDAQSDEMVGSLTSQLPTYKTVRGC
jgi:YidC/Oxa1 family membrane protein insertase